ncbi:GDSL-type esterase/lipase family protein [Allomuricauda sp. d1]|uniref:SGNH/GDSL hydrolase family protein n=1 Tax=Allomuricauda sp. d1 TaxID=3136725 RepID=UPI0031E20E44
MSIEFAIESPKEFLVLKYNWKEKRTTNTIKKVLVDSMSPDFLRLTNVPLPDQQQFSNYTAYSLDSGNRESYFRCTTVEQSASGAAIFKGVVWINRIPRIEKKYMTLKTVELPLLQKGNSTVVTIGDSHFIWRDARSLRKELSLKNDNIKFVGSFKDSYGFPHEAKVFDSSKDLLARIDGIPDAATYIFFFGAHDKNKDIKEVETQICTIFEKTIERNPQSRLVAITLPPAPNPKVEAHNLRFNRSLENCASKSGVSIIDLHHLFDDERGYLRNDGVHLNQYGNNLLVRELLKVL